MSYLSENDWNDPDLIILEALRFYRVHEYTNKEQDHILRDLQYAIRGGALYLVDWDEHIDSE